MKHNIPTIDHVWITIALGLVALRPLLTPIPPHDFWWHMAVGRITVTTGVIPTTDTFSYTRFGEPFYNQGWLAQAFLYVVHRLGGVEVLLVIQSIIIAITYGVLLYVCVRRSGALRISVVLMLLTVMPLSFDNWNVRPQTYAFPLFMAFFAILTIWRTQEHDSSRPSWRTGPLWALPVLMAVWVNVHGSFVLGGVLITLVFVGEWVRRLVGKRTQRAGTMHAPDAESTPQNQQTCPPLRDLFVWGAITAVAMFLNPRGPAVYAYVSNLLNTSAVTRMVTEWAPPTVRDTNGAIFFLFLIMVMLIVAYTSRRPDGVDMLIVVPFLWLALGASRHIVWFGMVVTPLLVQQVASWDTFTRYDTSNHRARGVPMMNSLIIGFVALLLLLALPWIKPHLGLPPELGNLLSPHTPVQAVEVVRSDPKRPHHLFHAMSYGSYLIWAVPDLPVFADPRIELYPTSQWLDYIALNNGMNVDTLIRRYAIDGLLLDREEQQGLLDVVADDPTWVVRYEDSYTVYLVRE